MADRPVLMLVGTSISTFGDPAKADRYIEWYKKVHIPLTVKAPGMLRGTMYRCVGQRMEYPNFMTVYELENKQVIEKAMRSPEMAKAIEDGHQNGPALGMVMRWHVDYEQLNDSEELVDTSPVGDITERPVVMLVGSSIPTFGSSEEADPYIEWYKKVHIPLTVKAPGMLRGTMYQCVGQKLEYPDFLTIYELESKQVIEKAMRSPEMAKAIEDGQQNGPSHGMIMRWHVVYEPV